MKCPFPDCSEEVPEKRAQLGYRTCLKHGAGKKEFPTAPLFNKGGLQLVTRQDLRSLGRKDEA
jgi:hypothetical protein